MKYLKFIFSGLLFTFILGMGNVSTLRAADTLIPNADMQKDADHDGWPDGWPRLPGNSTWESEGTNRFIRLKSTEPGKMLMLFMKVPVPADAKAMELSFKVRAIDIKPGKQPWFDGRIIMDFVDISGEKLSSPSAPYVKGDSKGWIERKTLFLVPEGAKTLNFMPALFQVQSGTMDLDDVVLKVVDPAEVLAAQAAAKEKAAPADPIAEAPKTENWPKELKVVGNRLQDPSGKEVWLQGVHVVSMEWNPRGESVLNSIKVAIEDWKANVIRLSVKPAYWSGEEGGDPVAYKALIDAAVNMAANRGAYLLIDNHSYRALKESDLTFWTEVATKYKNNPAVLFDMINEPHSISWEVWKNGGFVEEKKEKADEDNFLTPEEKAKRKNGYDSPGMQKMVETIRATGAKNIIVAGGLDWAYDLSGVLKGFALEDKTGNGIMYSAHIYPWKSDWQGKVLDVAAKYPIFVGEVGGNTKKMGWMPAERQEDAATWVPAVLGLIQKYKLNWSAFSFHPSAAPVLLLDWKYTPTPEWGVPAKEALSGKQFQLDRLR